MISLKSYASGQWRAGTGKERVLHHAVTGEPLATCSSEGLDFRGMLDWGRGTGGPALRAMSFPERAAVLKKMAGVLNEHLGELYEVAATYGATQADAKMDVDGGVATLGYFASLGSKKLPATHFLVDGDEERLSKDGHFVGRHILVPLEGVAVQINAYNFPSWGMLEKLAPAFLSGMPSLVKPATPSAYLTFRMTELLIGSGMLPEGSLQLVCGSIGDLLDHLGPQEVVSFTGSASTARKIRAHPNVVANAVRVNIEADSLNVIVLGPDVEPESPTFDFFVKEVVREMTVKAGQKCTAIRRVLVPRDKETSVIDALRARLSKIRVGNPATEGVRMGPLVDRDAVIAARKGIEALQEETEIVYGDPEGKYFVDADGTKGAFMEPVLLRCTHPETARKVHEVEIFGPAATILAYRTADEAIDQARRGGGSLVGSMYSEDEGFIGTVTFGVAPYHGRLMVMNARAAAESTGHGVVMPHLVHGGPGRAGGGEELGGLRSLHHYMQRVALQGDPERLGRLIQSATP